MKNARILALLVFACLPVCHYGTSVKNFPPAKGPSGVMVQVTTDQRALSGELIEVRDTGLVVLAEQKLHLLPYAAILSSRIDQIPSQYAIRERRAPTPDARDHLRLLSRFPQGLTAELLQSLLRTYQQTELAGVSP